MIKKQTRFQRLLRNESKLGAYYTDVGHSHRIGRMFVLPKETCLLEPSIGDAEAVCSFLDGAEKGETQFIYGVELNENTYEKVSKKPELNYCLKGDFLSEIQVTKKAFSLCFANPPYMWEGRGSNNECIEKSFVETIFQYMKTDGYLVLIVSFLTLREELFYKSLLARFECCGIWRFDEEEYAKYKQVVFVGKRREKAKIMLSEIKSFDERLDIERIPFLPKEEEEPEKKFVVPGSLDRDIGQFTQLTFAPETVVDGLYNSPLYDYAEKKILIKPYRHAEIGIPPLPLKKDLLYLCAVAGGGQGFAGSEEEGDLHLQRGVAKVIENCSINSNDETDCTIQTVTSHTQMSISIIEYDGEVTILK